MIEFHSLDIEVPVDKPELFVSALLMLIKKEGFTADDINVVCCTDEHLLKINIESLDHDYYTDIITFDYSDENKVSGDLFISVDRVRENAKIYNVSFEKEFARVCAHGVLHLCGYKDKSEADIKIMREKEEEYLPLFCST